MDQSISQHQLQLQANQYWPKEISRGSLIVEVHWHRNGLHPISNQLKNVSIIKSQIECNKTIFAGSLFRSCKLLPVDNDLQVEVFILSTPKKIGIAKVPPHVPCGQKVKEINFATILHSLKSFIVVQQMCKRYSN